MTTVGYVAVMISVRLVACILCKCSLVSSEHRQTVKTSSLWVVSAVGEKPYMTTLITVAKETTL